MPMSESNDVPESAYEELLDTFGASNLSELEAIVDIIEARTGESPRDEAWGWDSPPEFYFHDFNPRALREDFLTYITERSEVYEEVAFYQTHGSFRDTSLLTDEEEGYVDAHVFNTVENQCYYNAQTSVSPELKYVEGYRISPKHPRPAPHAWLEHKGKVVELTIPREFNPDALYYGVEYSAQTVTEALSNRERAEPLVEEHGTYKPI